MPVLSLYVGWCLPLPIPSSNIALPTQKLMSYPTLKLTTHMLPDPKTQQKTNNSQQPTCYPAQKLNGKLTTNTRTQGPSVGATVGIGRSIGTYRISRGISNTGG